MNLNATPTTIDDLTKCYDVAVRLFIINSWEATNKFQGTSAHLNVKLKVEEGLVTYKQQVFSSSSNAVCDYDEEWLEAGLKNNGNDAI